LVGSVPTLVERHFDFRGGRFDTRQLRVTPEGAAALLRVASDGLWVGIPRGAGPDEVAFQPRWAIEGDFQISASFELLRIDKPRVGYGVGPGVHLVFESGGRDAATLSRLLRVKEGDVFAAHYAVDDPQNANKRKHRVTFAPAAARAGKLRLVRFGETLDYSVADSPEGPFRRIWRTHVVRDRVREIRFVLNRHGTTAGGEVIWKNVTIRAERICESQARGGGVAIAAALLVAATLAGWLWYCRVKRVRDGASEC